MQEAHLAITDLTITSVRESGADFTMPFMNLGEHILKGNIDLNNYFFLVRNFSALLETKERTAVHIFFHGTIQSREKKIVNK